MDDLHATLNSPFQSATEITKPQVELVTEEGLQALEQTIEYAHPYADPWDDIGTLKRLIATVRHYQRKVRDMEAAFSLAEAHILALQTELGEARTKMIEAQQLLEGK